MYSKTLGPENARLLTALAGRDQAIFSFEDARQVTGKNYSATAELIHRLVKAGWVVRLGAGKYALVPLASGEEAIPETNQLVIVREIVGDAPYYVSHDSALDFHNMLTRPVTSVTVTTTRRMPNRQVLGVPYRFVAARLEGMWAYIPAWVTPSEQVNISDLERTILDGLSRPDLCAGVSEVAAGLWMRKDDLDWQKLIAYTLRLQNQAVAKRLGFLLELYELGSEQPINQLQEFIGPSYALLDPMLPPEGRYLARWRVRVNIDPEGLKGIVTT